MTEEQIKRMNELAEKYADETFSDIADGDEQTHFKNGVEFGFKSGYRAATLDAQAEIAELKAKNFALGISRDFYKDEAKEYDDKIHEIRALVNAETEDVVIDISRLQEQLASQKQAVQGLVEALEFYANDNNWYLYKDLVTGAEVRRSIQLDDTESFGFQASPESPNILQVFAGKRAKAALNQWREKGL